MPYETVDSYLGQTESIYPSLIQQAQARGDCTDVANKTFAQCAQQNLPGGECAKRSRAAGDRCRAAQQQQAQAQPTPSAPAATTYGPTPEVSIRTETAPMEFRFEFEQPTWTPQPQLVAQSPQPMPAEPEAYYTPEELSPPPLITYQAAQAPAYQPPAPADHGYMGPPPAPSGPSIPWWALLIPVFLLGGGR